MIKNKLFLLLILATLPSLNAFAKDSSDKDGEQYPNISGRSLFEFRGNRISSADKNIIGNNTNMNIDTYFSANFSKNWSLVTDWRFEPMNQSQNNPERYREMLSSKKGIGIGQNALVVDQLKGQFENEDARFVVGKFNPAFGSAFRKEKRIGIFTTNFTRDYELRGKLGIGITAILENSELAVNAFCNDSTGLSNSAIKKKGVTKKSDALAGNTSTPSSYAITMQGQDLGGIDDLFYNFGYRNLAVGNVVGRDSETGFVAGLEYLIPIGLKSSLIPFFEVVKIDNLSGIAGRNSIYMTVSLVAKYSSWTASIANVTRSIAQKDISTAANLGQVSDRQLEYSIGYQFNKNIALDLTSASIKEDNRRASVFGVLLSYAYNF